MTTKVSISRRWTEPIPIGRDGQPIPKNLWPRRRKHVWIVRWFAPGPDGKIVRPSRRFATREEAEKFQAEKLQEFSENPLARRRPPQVTFGQFTAEFERMRVGPRGDRLKASSVASAKYALRRLGKVVGKDRPLGTITGHEAVHFFNKLREEGLSPASINKLKRTLRAAFQVAIDPCRYVRINPFAGIRSDRLAATQKRYVTPQEFAALIASCAELKQDRVTWWRAFLSVAYVAGLRFSEIVHLTWMDVDFESETIRVVAKRETPSLLEWTPKSYHGRTIPIPAPTVEILAHLQEQATEGHPYVFLPAERLSLIKAAQHQGSWKEHQAILNNVRREFGELVLRAAAGAASLACSVDGRPRPIISIHDLRRSAITNWSKRVNLQTLRQLAGHSNISTTVEYYAVATDDQRRLARIASLEALGVGQPQQTDPKLTPTPPREAENRVLELGRTGVEPVTHGFSVRC